MYALLPALSVMRTYNALPDTKAGVPVFQFKLAFSTASAVTSNRSAVAYSTFATSLSVSEDVMVNCVSPK